MLACLGAERSRAQERKRTPVFVLHACWLIDTATPQPGRLALWAEDSSAPTTPPRRPGRRPRVQDHPYAAAGETLRTLLPPPAVAAPLGTATLTLPTRGGAPTGSPELVRDEIGEVAGEVRPGAWQVPTVDLEADVAYAVLRRWDPDGPVCGGSVHHLSEVAAFAADLVARGRILPIALDDPPRAGWRPVLTGPDAAWARVLATSMPPSLGAADPGQSLTVWAAALDSLVDAAARAALGPLRLSLGRAGTPVSRAWLAALTGTERTFAAEPAQVAALASARPLAGRRGGRSGPGVLPARRAGRG